ncbi:MAG: hypothetical protein ABIB97_04780 [Patescibacteria group bacterium]
MLKLFGVLGLCMVFSLGFCTFMVCLMPPFSHPDHIHKMPYDYRRWIRKTKGRRIAVAMLGLVVCLIGFFSLMHVLH